MAIVIGIMGESGAGKTTSMRNLDPKTTYYIDCDKKGLNYKGWWKGWRQQYNEENKNYYKTDFPQTVLKLLEQINDKAKHIETVVIDTLNGIMVADEMRRCKEKGYDKWQDLAQCVYSIIDYALTMRDDLTVIFIAHAQVERDDSGNTFTRIKTSGKKLDKIQIETKLTTVLLAKCVDGRHVFETHSNFSTSKTPLGAFEEDEIDNDITKVIEVLKEF